MATTTFTCNKDTRVANNGSNLGAGASDYLPVGLYSGYLYRSLLGFSYSFAGMVSITSATLHLKTSGQSYVAFGSDPDVEVRRITSSWSEGSSVSLSGSNATVYPGPSVNSTNMATFDVATTENTWVSVDITGIMQDALAAGTFYGLNLRAVDETSATDVTEFYAREYGSNDAYISVTYSTDTVPDAPTINSPTASELVASTTPTISITHNDPQGSACVSFDMQIDTTTGDGVAPDWSSLTWSTTTDTSDLTNPITKVTGTLTRGQWYALRARTADSLGNGAWSATRYFKVGVLPTATVTTPTSGHTAKVYYTAGTNTTPRFEVSWTFADTDGHTQTGASIKVYADSAGTPGSLLHTHTHTGSATTAQLTGYTPANGTKYHISVTPTCSISLAGNESTKNITRVRWGRASYFADLTSAPAGLGTPSPSTTSSGTSWVTVEYATTASTVEPTTWYSTMSGTPQRYIWHRVTMGAHGSATPTSPSVNSIAFPYTASVPIPDLWDTSQGGVIDQSTYTYGTQSLKLVGTGATTFAGVGVSGLIPGLVYTLSGRIKSQGNSGAYVQCANGGVSFTVTPITATQDFGELDTDGNDKSKVSVSFTATDSTGMIYCAMVGAVGTSAWFDALKLEQSPISTPWSPGFVSGGVTVDSAGLQVDGSAGGILRLRGTAGGTGDEVSLGAHGLILGTIGLSSGTAFPTSPATDEQFYRTDLGLWFTYDGTRWVSTQLFTVPLIRLGGSQPYSASTSTLDGPSVAMPHLQGGSNIWLVRHRAAFQVATGGTALSASHSWAGSLRKFSDVGSFSTIVTATIDSGNSDDLRFIDTAIGALVGSYYVLRTVWTKTGSPGNLYVNEELSYRIVAT